MCLLDLRLPDLGSNFAFRYCRAMEVAVDIGHDVFQGDFFGPEIPDAVDVACALREGSVFAWDGVSISR